MDKNHVAYRLFMMIVIADSMYFQSWIKVSFFIKPMSQEAQLPQRNSASAAHVYLIVQFTNNAYVVQLLSTRRYRLVNSRIDIRQYQLRKRPTSVADEAFEHYIRIHTSKFQGQLSFESR